mmetsp:Transcript_30984/g.34558  ORF Transcript_30984/g.34558 Transcript_30984/m.34558 type:complete len:135 (+) Transcript_30984:336-740(+)
MVFGVCKRIFEWINTVKAQRKQYVKQRDSVGKLAPQPRKAPRYHMTHNGSKIALNLLRDSERDPTMTTKSRKRNKPVVMDVFQDKNNTNISKVASVSFQSEEEVINSDDDIVTNDSGSSSEEDSMPKSILKKQQ